MTPNRTRKYSDLDAEYLKEYGLNCLAYYDDKIETAEKLGYDSFIGALVDVYRKLRSGRKAGKLLGVSQYCVIVHARRLGITMPRGGNNNPGNGATINGPACKNCGSTKRYQRKPHHCIPCHRKKNREAYQKRKSAGQTTTGAI